MAGDLRYYDSEQSEAELDRSIRDTRPALATGFAGMDSLLRRGGLLPGNFAILAGRTGTRKTTVMANMAVNMVRNGVSVGIVGLDEPLWGYRLKLMSVWSGVSQGDIEEAWCEERGKAIRRDYHTGTSRLLHLFAGRRPMLENLEGSLSLVDVGQSQRPTCVFIDYLGLLSRDGPYGFSEGSRIPRLSEDLQEWSTRNEVALVVLHQLNRNDEFGSSNSRNEGQVPVTLSQLKYGAEEQADVVFGAYRLALDPVGNMSIDAARAALGDKYDEEDYYHRRQQVKKYQHSTHLQLLKNRPGTMTEPSGIELLSPTQALGMTEKEGVESYAARARSV